MPSDRPNFKAFSQYIDFRKTLCKVLIILIQNYHIPVLVILDTLGMVEHVIILTNVLLKQVARTHKVAAHAAVTRDILATGWYAQM